MFLYHNIDFFHTNNIGKKSIEIVKHMSFRCEREGMEGRGESREEVRSGWEQLSNELPRAGAYFRDLCIFEVSSLAGREWWGAGSEGG